MRRFLRLISLPHSYGNLLVCFPATIWSGPPFGWSDLFWTHWSGQSGNEISDTSNQRELLDGNRFLPGMYGYGLGVAVMGFVEVAGAGVVGMGVVKVGGTTPTSSGRADSGDKTNIIGSRWYRRQKHIKTHYFQVFSGHRRLETGFWQACMDTN